MELFGFKIQRKSEDKKPLETFVEVTGDGSLDIASGGVQSSFIALDGSAANEAALITRYRTMAMHPEVQYAIDDIVNEAIVIGDRQKVVTCVTDDIEVSDKVKKAIAEEFENILTLLDFSNQAYEIFSRWYIDGRIYYHAMIDPDNIKDGIKELRYIDPRKLKKIREYEDENKSIKGQRYVQKNLKDEYYLFNDIGYDESFNRASTVGGVRTQGLKVALDAIMTSNSGLLNEFNSLILSHLDKAFKPLNQLTLMEDAALIYRISRAPERRVFYIDVGNLPKIKAEQHLRDMMANFKSKLSYNTSTGEINNSRRVMSVTDDFWLPRRGQTGQGTQIETLPGGQSLGELSDVEYFKDRLYKALNVPISRMQPDTAFSFGRANEITRDEIKFAKFVRRLQVRFSILFDDILEKQLVMKNIINPEDWEDIKDNLRYDFNTDNHYEELKESEMLRERMTIMQDVSNYTGEYFSREWVRKNILKMTEDEIEEIDKQIEQEKKDFPDDEAPDNFNL